MSDRVEQRCIFIGIRKIESIHLLKFSLIYELNALDDLKIVFLCDQKEV